MNPRETVPSRLFLSGSRTASEIRTPCHVVMSSGRLRLAIIAIGRSSEAVSVAISGLVTTDADKALALDIVDGIVALRAYPNLDAREVLDGIMLV